MENTTPQLDFSSYGIMTAKRVLANYDLKFSNDDVKTIMKNTSNIYGNFLNISLQNISNGLVLMQTKDYHIYLQKLFINYLVTSNPPDKLSGTKRSIEEKRLELVKFGEEFLSCERDHYNLVSQCQKNLKNIAKKWLKSLNLVAAKIHKDLTNTKTSDIIGAFHYSFAHLDSLNQTASSAFTENFKKKLGVNFSEDKFIKEFEIFTQQLATFKDDLQQFVAATQIVNTKLKNYRSEFYQEILRVTQLFSQLSDYNQDDEKVISLKDHLKFDREVI